MEHSIFSKVFQDFNEDLITHVDTAESSEVIFPHQAILKASPFNAS